MSEWVFKAVETKRGERSVRPSGVAEFLHLTRVPVCLSSACPHEPPPLVHAYPQPNVSCCAA